MELLVLLALLLLIYLLVAPLLALLNAGSAKSRVEQLTRLSEGLQQQIEDLRREVGRLARNQAPDAADAAATTPPTTAEAAQAAPEGSSAEPGPAQAEDVPMRAASARAATPAQREQPVAGASWADAAAMAGATTTSETPASAEQKPPPAGPIDLPEPLPVAAASAAGADQPAAGRAVYAVGHDLPDADAAAHAAPSRPRPPPPRPAPPRSPPAWQLQLGKAWQMAREWLFGGNLVAKVGLAILFIGVAFLLRHASNYVVVPIEVRLAGIAAGAIALLVWGWRIRLRRPGIALPVQGAALATLMLVVFGAFKLYGLLPAGATFALLLTLVAFTCLLAVLQDALWLAIFGIVGGFAVPILTSTGSGSHVALFSYYALLNAGILAIAWLRAWRSLNVLGFAFTFIIGSAWGYQEYLPEHYASSQGFLILFLLFYVAIAILYARQEAPKLRSYVDGTLVFGVPTVAMGLQYGLVKDFELGAALSALALGLFYSGTASALWRWRAGGLRLLVECFFALAVVFGTLAIPLAFDGRWTSAAWALEGAGITWIGLRQRQPLVWRFGILVQLGSWLAFLKALTGIDALTALGEHFSLGFALLGATGVFVALLLRPSQSDAAAGTASRPGWLGPVFLCVAVAWLLSGLWLEVWLRVDPQARGGLLVLTAFGLVLALQWLANRVGWRLPALLGGVVSTLAGVVFLALMFRYMRWRDLPDPAAYSLGEMLSQGALMGGVLLSAAALVSAFGFQRRASEQPERDQRAAGHWLLLAMFWSAGFALHGLAHLIAWATAAGANPPPLYGIGFWSAYGIGLAGLAWGWSVLAQRAGFANRRLVSAVLWPALSALGTLAFLAAQEQVLPNPTALLAFSRLDAAPEGLDSVLRGLLGSPLLGAGLLLLCGWQGLRWSERADNGVADDQRGLLRAIWLLGLAIVAYLPLAEPLARAGQQTLALLSSDAEGMGRFSRTDLRLLVAALLSVLALQLARAPSRQSLRWLVLPAAALQLLATGLLLARLYLDARLPSAATGIALAGLWAAMLWSLRCLQADPGLPTTVLKLAHIGRVIGPWLMLPAVLSLNLQRWLQGPADAGSGWIVAGQWPDYLAAWAALALLLLGLRQVRRQGWPLAPLATWYGRAVIPLAALWALLLVIYWNLRQDGSMQPLPYLPLLNPLDISTAFVALLLFDLWRLHAATLAASTERWLRWTAAALLFGWFNAILLRSAAQYLGLPYRFEALYESQFVQAMLSITWTLCAFALMQYAVRRLTRTLWIIGAALLAVVVLKLFMIDLKHIGGVARIVSFMGVGGLMLLIGYLAPLPRSGDQPANAGDERDERNEGALP